MEDHKSTRDKSRNALTAESKKTRRGKRRRNVDSSDDDDDSYNRQDRQKERERDTSRHNKPKVESELKRLAGKYRDRAKERQDGLSNDHNEEVLHNDLKVGDEIFENIVKAVESGDRQMLKSIATTTTSTIPTARGTIPVTPKEALSWIGNDQNVAQTALGKGVLEYLRRNYNANNCNAPIQVSASGRSLHQSVMTFNSELNIDPRDRARSWERPFEQMFATSRTHSNQQQENGIRKASFLNNLDLLHKIQSSFDKRDRRIEKTKREKTRREKPNSAKKLKGVTTTGSLVDGGDEDDDDDIFASIGEYNADENDEAGIN